MEMNEVQKKIAELQDKGWSLAALADELELNSRTVEYWRHGKRYPENVKAVMMALNTIGRRNPPKRRRYAGTHHLQRKKAESGE